MVNGIIRKLFYLNAWSIGYRRIDKGFDGLPSVKDKVQYTAIPINEHMYYADPFLVENGSNVYLFAESMNRYRGLGTLSVSLLLPNGRFSRFKEILREDFHLSYPNVFEVNGTYYMIPETSSVCQVRLYEAVEFPYKWKLKKILLDNGRRYTDNALIIGNDSITLIAFCEEKMGFGRTECYQLDKRTFNIELNETLTSSFANERPAGNPIKVTNKWYRPVQDCKDYYGKAVNVLTFEPCHKEKKVAQITPEAFEIDLAIKEITGTHTLNRSKNYEVIDFKYNKFCISCRIIWLFHTLKRIISHKR